MEGKTTHVRFGGFAFAAGTPGGPRLMEAMFQGGACGTVLCGRSVGEGEGRC